jgi:hypothetical protein
VGCGAATRKSRVVCVVDGLGIAFCKRRRVGGSSYYFLSPGGGCNTLGLQKRKNKRKTERAGGASAPGIPAPSPLSRHRAPFAPPVTLAPATPPQKTLF